MLTRLLPHGSRRRAFVKAIAAPFLRSRTPAAPSPPKRPAVPEHLRVHQRNPEPAALAAVETALRRGYFQDCPAGYLETEHGRGDLQEHLTRRLDEARGVIIPWLDSARELHGRKVLEIGCGTGSDLVALAEQGAKVTALDVDERSLAVARQRLDAFGLSAALHAANARQVGELFAGESFDLIIFYASLEHMVHAERLEAMRRTWEMLPAGGMWCVVETPNRLWYRDGHTSLLPFFHWLPDELAFEYSRFSPRYNFREIYREKDDARMLHFLRRGRGMSFHEFALAMKPPEELDVVSSKRDFLRGPASAAGDSVGEEYFALLTRLCPGIHSGFFCEYLDLILRKH